MSRESTLWASRIPFQPQLALDGFPLQKKSSNFKFSLKYASFQSSTTQMLSFPTSFSFLFLPRLRQQKRRRCNLEFHKERAKTGEKKKTFCVLWARQNAMNFPNVHEIEQNAFQLLERKKKHITNRKGIFSKTQKKFEKFFNSKFNL